MLIVFLIINSLLIECKHQKVLNFETIELIERLGKKTFH
jgi:hypothetical protein